MYNFIGVEEEPTNLETVEETPARTAYQQFYQAESQTTGATQGQPVAMGNYVHEAFTDPSWVDPASYQGKITDPSVLLTNPGYGFLLEQTNTEDHDNDGINDLDDLDDDNDGILDVDDLCSKGNINWLSTIASDFDSDGCKDTTEIGRAHV